MADKTKKSLSTATDQIEDRSRPYSVFYVDTATPKAINVETVMAASEDEARGLTGEKYPYSMILYVREVGSKDVSGDPAADRACNRDLPPLDELPGARFINGEFHPEGSPGDLSPDALAK